MTPRLVIAGGSGFLGRLLLKYGADRGHDVVLLTRQRRAHPDWAPIEQIPWDGKGPGRWVEAIDGADSVINLSGKSVNCRYSAGNRRAILASRIDSTRAIGEAIASSRRPPRLWLNASTATIYRHSLSIPQDEATGRIGAGFSVDVARRWEQALFAARTPETRRVALRTSIVFDRESGGAFDYFRRIAAAGWGGPIGSGDQRVSWIHGHDWVRALSFIRECEAIEGVVNLSAPRPVTQADLMQRLCRSMGRELGWPTPAWLLELGAFALRTESELLLKSRFVLPALLRDRGFRFRYPDLDRALLELVDRQPAPEAGAAVALPQPLYRA